MSLIIISLVQDCTVIQSGVRKGNPSVLYS